MISYFTTLSCGWLNAWIPSFLIILVQMLYLMVLKEGGKRAVDTSWYTIDDRKNFNRNSWFQTVYVFLSLFVPLKIGTMWFVVGMVVYAFALTLFVIAFQSYTTAPFDKVITKGIYKISRNPMYFSFNVGILGICIASASLWLLIPIIPIVVFTHLIIKGEERYCENTYGQEYLRYKNTVARYFVFF